MNSTSTVGASMPSTNQSCISSILTLRGFFTLFDTQRQAIYMNASASGTVINGCLEQLLTSSLNLSADKLSNSASTTGPFWATTTPLIFVVAITVTLAYVLLLMTLMSRIRRPWLQRCAILSVAVSLTLAAVLMWRELERQHTSMFGYNADRVKDIRANTALKVLRIVSNSILWLAQVQVLIRIFPRRVDKVVIKWAGLCLIVLQTVFAILNDFFHPSSVNPDSTNSLIPAIPVLAYLFHIAIGVLYAVCVVIFSCTSGRWRYAYGFHSLPYALASLVSVCFPVIFFCLDIWSDQVDGWGDYVRWVSSAAACVIVWDWVAQIQFKVQKNSTNGVLGREVFEDEMNIKQRKLTKYEHAHDTGNLRMITRIRSKLPSVTKRRVSSGYEIELPVIRHPITRETSDLRLSHQTSTIISRPRSHLPSTQTSLSDASRSVNTGQSSCEDTNDRVMSEIQRRPEAGQVRNIDSVSSIEPSYSVNPSTAGRPDSLVHDRDGFEEGDYWLDEKE